MSVVDGTIWQMVTVEAIRKLARSLPRTEEAIVRDRLKYRVRGLVYVALSQDETDMGFAYPKHERDALIASDPAKFHRPAPSDERLPKKVAADWNTPQWSEPDIRPGLPGSDGASRRCTRRRYNNGIGLLARPAIHPSDSPQPPNNIRF